MKSRPKDNRFAVIDTPTDAELEEFQKGFETYNLERTNGEYNSPKDWLSLVLEDHDENLV